MKIYLILHTISFTLIFVSSVQYDQRCTFSSGTCDWNIGRRWQVRNLDDDTDDKVLIAVDGSNEDREKGFTDTITSSWLYLTASCSFAIRLTFQFSIENEQDQIEVFLIHKDRTHVSSIGRWKALTEETINLAEEIDSLWQQANITFKATEEFRVEIEIRHLPDTKTTTTTWFAIDDILIESCPNMPATTTSQTQKTTTATSRMTHSYLGISNTSLLHPSLLRFRWKFNDSSSISSTEEPLSAQLTFLTFILYILYALVAMALLIIIIAIIIFTYRKHCLPPSTSSAPIIEHRHHSSKRKRHTHSGTQHNSHIDQDARTEKTMVTTVRPYY